MERYQFRYQNNYTNDTKKKTKYLWISIKLILQKMYEICMTSIFP